MPTFFAIPRNGARYESEPGFPGMNRILTAERFGADKTTPPEKIGIKIFDSPTMRAAARLAESDPLLSRELIQLEGAWLYPLHERFNHDWPDGLVRVSSPDFIPVENEGQERLFLLETSIPPDRTLTDALFEAPLGDEGEREIWAKNVAMQLLFILDKLHTGGFRHGDLHLDTVGLDDQGHTAILDLSSDMDPRNETVALSRGSTLYRSLDPLGDAPFATPFQPDVYAVGNILHSLVVPDETEPGFTGGARLERPDERRDRLIQAGVSRQLANVIAQFTSLDFDVCPRPRDAGEALQRLRDLEPCATRPRRRPARSDAATAKPSAWSKKKGVILPLSVSTVINATLGEIGSIAGFTELILENCGAITADGLALLPESKRIERVVLSGCGKITDAAIPIVLDKYPAVRSISLACCPITDETIETLKRFANLNRLDLSGCRELTEEGYLKLGELRSLTDLTLNLCHQTEDTWLETLPALRGLSVRECVRLSGSFLPELPSLNRETLRELDFSKCSSLDPGASEWIVACVNLEILHLSETGAAGGNVVQKFDALSKLRCLSLDNCRDFNDASLRLLPPFPKLEFLDLSGNNISDIGLQAITRARFPQLKHFVAMHCPRISDKAKQRLIRMVDTAAF